MGDGDGNKLGKSVDAVLCELLEMKMVKWKVCEELVKRVGPGCLSVDCPAETSPRGGA